MLNLPHVASRVFGAPLMIARGKLEVILSVLAPRFAGGTIGTAGQARDPAPLVSMTPEGIAIVPIVGTLVSRSGFIDAASGLLSYGDIGSVIAGALNDPAVKGVILDMDSPGGEVGGLFDLVDGIRAHRATGNKPLWAVANESALSAAYAIASAADRIYVTRTGELGSIGVVAAHVDESGADAKAGLAWSFIFAGDRKVDGNSHGPLSESARADVQADVDRLYAEFCATVAANRGLTPDAVRATEAAIYRGYRAVAAGLADRIGTLEAAISDMMGEVDRDLAPPPPVVTPKPRRSLAMASNATESLQPQAAAPEHGPTPDVAEPGPPEPATTRLPTPQSDPAAAIRAEYAEIADIAAQAARLGVIIDAADAMRKGIKPDALRRTVLDSLAQHSEAASIIAAAPSTPIAGDSPIVRRAKERAAANQK
jgi:signal peptide peptidase SppA